MDKRNKLLIMFNIQFPAQFLSVCTCTLYIYQYLQILQKMSENGLFSSNILDCSVALNNIENNMIDSVKVGLNMENRPNKFSFLAPTAQCRAGFEPFDERRLAEQKSPILTAQTTQPA